MKKLSLIVIVDGAFIFFTAFLILYTFIKPLVKSIVSATIIVVFLSAIITLIFIMYINQREEKKGNKILSEKLYSAFLKYLYLADNNAAVNTLKDYYEIQNLTFKSVGNYFLLGENSAVFYNFSVEKLNVDKIIEFYKKTPKGLSFNVVLCDIDNSVIEKLKELNIDIKIVKARDVYCLLKEHNKLPSLEAYMVKKQKPKINFKVFLKKENSHKFLLWGAVFMALSYITYFKYLYLLLGSTFLITAVYLRFFSKATS